MVDPVILDRKVNQEWSVLQLKKAKREIKDWMEKWANRVFAALQVHQDSMEGLEIRDLQDCLDSPAQLDQRAITVTWDLLA